MLNCTRINVMNLKAYPAFIHFFFSASLEPLFVLALVTNVSLACLVLVYLFRCETKMCLESLTIE